MALFGIGKKKQEQPKVEARKLPKAEAKDEKPSKKEEAASVPIVVAGTPGGLELSSVLRKPHVTEKATDLSMKNVYAFDIHSDANKAAVTAAVEKYYKVTPRKVAIIRSKRKTTRSNRTGRTVMKKQATKKALVYLKKGDKIEFV